MAIYFFDKDQDLIKIVPDSATIENYQTQELDDDSLLKDTLSVTVNGDEKLLDAEYMAVKSYTGNSQTFDMYRIVTDTTPDKSMSFTGMSLAPYELNGHIIQDLRPANHSLEYTLNRVLTGTDWRLGYMDDGLSNVTTTFYYVSVKEALKELQSLVGCEFVFKVEISGQKITDKWIEVYKEMGNRTKKRFNYGTNALTVVRETNKADIYTALIGRGKGEEVSSADENESGQAGYGRKITFEEIEWSTAKGNPLNKPIGQYYLELPQATQAYGIKNIDGTMKARVGIVDFDDEEDKNRLINLTYQQLLVSSRPKVLFKTTVANIGATGIGDTVTIHRHDLKIHYQTRVRKIVRNKLNDNKTQIELGDAVVTASTKQAKQNKATIKNLNQEIEKVKADVNTSQTSADGKNTIFYGPAEPTRQRTGDTWYRPHPSISGERQMLVWNGTAWEVVIDTSDLTKVAREVEVAQEEADKAVQSAKDADARANEAIEKAGANANLLTTHQNTLDTIKNTTIPNVNKVASDAMAEAKTALSSASSAMDEAKKADGKIADYVTKNGLVNGTTVDNKIDTATGEISRKVTTLEANKLDGTTYTNFYDNEYKQTAQGVTDAWTAVNKIIDANGNSTDSFAKAVYNRNATRQSADFKNVTDGLVKTATYTDGINGLSGQITGVKGSLEDIGSPNYAIDSESIPVHFRYGYQGATVDYHDIDMKEEWGFEKAYQLDVSGGNSVIRMLTGTNSSPSTLSMVSGKTYTASVWVKNNGNQPFSLQTNGLLPDKGYAIPAGFSGRVIFSGYRRTDYDWFQIHVRTNDHNNPIKFIMGRLQIEDGEIATPWRPSPQDSLQSSEFVLFKNEYNETAEKIENRLTAIDSSAEGSVVSRLNKTESTAGGNATTISKIKTKPGEQITGYQTIKERSDLYERVIGSSSEASVKQNISRIVMTDSAFQTEVIDRQNLLTAMASGTGMTSDPYFNKGTNGLGVYDNGKTDTITIKYTKIPSTTSIPAPKGNDGYRLDITHTASSSTSPYRGGIVNQTNGWVNGTVVVKFVALLPTGRSFSYHNNSLGTGYAAGWLTDNSGTGKWETYMYYYRFGTGTVSNFGHLAVTGSSSAFSWYLSEYDIINVNETSASKITQLADNISLKVSKSDLLSQINVQAKGVLIQSGTNKLNVTPTTTYIQNGTIESAMIKSLDADKIKTGTLDAGKVEVVNLDANNITSNKSSFVRSVWNSLESSIRMDGGGLLSTASDGSQVYLQNGIVGVRNPDGATIGQIGYVFNGGSPTYTIQTSWGSNFAINQRFYDSYTKTTKDKEALSMYTTDNGYSETTIRMSRINILGDAHLSFHFRHSINGNENDRLTVNGAESVALRARDTTVFAVSNNGSTNFASLHANLNMQGNTVTNTSDIRLKRDVVNDEIDSLSALMEWQHAGFNYINPDMNQDRQFSVIAQSAPDLSFTGEDGYLQVSLNKQVNMTSHALQQHVIQTNNKVEQLEAQIASLQDELALLKGA